MKTNICELKQKKSDLKNILIEADKIAAYNDLDKKSTLRLRLLAEEMVGLLDGLVENFEGEFYIENNKNEFKLVTTLTVGNMNIELKDELIQMSSDKKNASAKGIMGKIRNAVQTLILKVDNADMYMTLADYTGYSHYEHNSPYSYRWSLDKYKTEVSKEKEEYDELEKSIVANVADDVIVGIKGRQVEIVVVKKF